MANDELERIKRLALIAMVSDDDLMDRLVLKGGNAIELIYKIDSRASRDLDFSIKAEFGKAELAIVEAKIRSLLIDTFKAAGYHVFDVKMEERPRVVSEELKSYWGGYRVEFKVIGREKEQSLHDDLEGLRRNAIKIGDKGRFMIDISKFEFCAGKTGVTVDGYTVYVYTPEMIAFEKLRAICQQMPEYAKQVKDRGASARARDFYDVYVIFEHFGVDARTAENKLLLKDIFEAKKVSLNLLGAVAEFREFHRPDFEAVRRTVSVGTQLREFDFYFDYVLAKVSELKPLWEVQVP
jgi:predicted nucleotidyltransferase component of viral defense system